METSKEVALTICEKIQNEYPKRPLWQTMLEIEDLIDKHVAKQLIIHGVVKSLKEDKPETFELWMESKGYRQNSKKQWLKHVYTMDARTLNNFKLEYESL